MKEKLLAVLLLFIFVPVVSAQINFNEEINSEDQAMFDQILEPVMKIYNLVKYLATVLAALVLLLAGVNYITSGSDPMKRENAKSMGMYVFIGLVVIWAAPIVVQFIVN